MSFERIAFVAGTTTQAQRSLQKLTKRYGGVRPDQADVIVALGGDGLMLETLHRFIGRQVPFYGMNRGTVGFLLNIYDDRDLLERLEVAHQVHLHPLTMQARTVDGTTMSAMAINEVSLLRQTRQAAKLRIQIDGAVRMPELVCDGAIIASPAGSTAYNLSAHGPIIPLGADLLALTPISAFRPRRWRGALLPASARLRLEVLEAKKRPVSAVADYTEVRDVRSVIVRVDHKTTLTLLFDPEHNLEDRILNEQFIP